MELDPGSELLVDFRKGQSCKEHSGTEESKTFGYFIKMEKLKSNPRIYSIFIAECGGTLIRTMAAIHRELASQAVEMHEEQYLKCLLFPSLKIL